MQTFHNREHNEDKFQLLLFYMISIIKDSSLIPILETNSTIVNK